MKRFILSLVFMLVASFSFAQAPVYTYFKNVNLNKYEVIDSLPIERVMIHFNKEIDDERLIYLGDGDYLAPVPHTDKMIIGYNSDKSKAIVIYNSYCFGRHLEFNIDDNVRRTVLWFKDKNIYCGYIYDKMYKVCKYFESKKEFNRFERHNLFNRNLKPVF